MTNQHQVSLKNWSQRHEEYPAAASSNLACGTLRLHGSAPDGDKRGRVLMRNGRRVDKPESLVTVAVSQRFA